MPARLMLDPSLLLSAGSLQTVRQAWEQGELNGAVIPNSFAVALRELRMSSTTAQYFVPSARRRGLEDILGLMRNASRIELEPYSPRERRWVRTPFAESLQAAVKEDLAYNILSEEWEFLTSESWIASRLRKPFSVFLRAGAVAVEWGGRSFDRVAARTLKVPPSEIPNGLNSGQRLRAVSKWIALGGSSAATLISPVPAALLTASTSFFLLLDP